MTAVDGPGRLGVFLSGIAPVVLVDSGDGLPDTTVVPLGTHAHANRGFGAEGTYRTTVEVVATLADGPAADRACAPPSTSPTTSTGTTSATTTSAGPVPTTPPTRTGPAGLASTGVGGVGTALPIAGLLVAAGAAALVTARRRRTHGG